MVPQRLGGPGATLADYVEVAMLLAGDGVTALIYNMHTSITGALAQTSDSMAALPGATDEYFEARDRALEAALNGSLFAVAMSERGAGSRLSKMTTAYEPEGNGFRVRGSKAFVRRWTCRCSTHRGALRCRRSFAVFRAAPEAG